MDAFLIIAAVLMFINTVFLVGSLVYTVKTTSSKVDAALDLGTTLGPRLSLQPQVVFYDAIVRISGNPLPGGEFNQQQITEKPENQTKVA